MATINGEVYEVLLGTGPTDPAPVLVTAPQLKSRAAAAATASDYNTKLAAGDLQGVTAPPGTSFCVRPVAVNITVTVAGNIAATVPELVAARIPVKLLLERGNGNTVLMAAVPPDIVRDLWSKYGG